MRASMMLRLSEEARPASDFFALVAHEIEAIETRVDEVWRDRVSSAWARPPFSVEEADLRFGARLVRSAEDGESRIEMRLGSALAFDDLALFALCNDLVLAPNLAALAQLSGDGDGAAYAAQNVHIGGVENKLRYRDYAFLNAQSDWKAAATYAAPSAQWRLKQAAVLSELMIAFTIMHERFHFALCHLDALHVDSQGENALAEDDVLSFIEDAPTALNASKASMDESAPRLSHASADYAGFRRLLEIHADAQAYFLLVAYALSKDGPCRRFAIGADDAAPDYALTQTGFEEGLRYCLTAASLACLVFHLAANPDPALRNPFYPSPHARLMNMMVNTPVLSPLTRIDEETGYVVMSATDRQAETGEDAPEFTRLVENVFALALNDLRVVASYFDGALSPLDAPDEAGNAEVAAWVADLGAFWISDDETLNTTPRTSPGRELEGLRPVEEAIGETLFALQRRRFGEATYVEVGAIGEDL